mmetsp:Transcript_89114/g.195218  ORF Transcript_89114/g.195218 Transcript_89114/m.195218 type:complete len:517 (+) Transcript_89114:390-1940(+)|eukprot:CAMPEP_0206435610 /NCGR_PEP_ID=MMETSP0324_2-20121206/9980_1 /ASSEMBLY_ACC=CAM_ASM_000836 /TAXON_ID=2866 /ORGANISM="Crypthecodinium cohnii, Strain Seligo" /LENGTH=516 /DNA_ID=CAMNT_0053902597 /DNA_START=320 /DNA_END=1870 /DNA_ORIENTATION=-
MTEIELSDRSAAGEVAVSDSVNSASEETSSEDRPPSVASMEVLAGSVWPAILTCFLQFLSFAILIPYISMLAALAPYSQVNKEGPRVMTPQTLMRAQAIISACHLVEALAELALSAAYGVLVDRIGVRWVALVSQTGFVVKAVVFAFCTPPESSLPEIEHVFAAMVVVSALRGATGMPKIPINAYIAKKTHPDKRTKRFGVMGAAFGLAFFCAQAFNVTIAETLGKSALQVPLLTSAVVAISSWLVVFFLWPKKVVTRDEQLAPWADALPWLLVKRTLLHSKTLMILSVIVFVDGLGVDLFHMAFGLFARARFGWDTEHLALYMMSVSCMTPLVMMCIYPRLLRWKGEIFVMRFASVSMLCSLSLTALVGLGNVGWLNFCVVPLIPLGSMLNPVLTSFATRELPVEELGRLSGALSAVETCARLVAPMLSAYIIPRTMHSSVPSAVYFLGVAIVIPGVALTWFVHPKAAAEAESKLSETSESITSDDDEGLAKIKDIKLREDSPRSLEENIIGRFA